MTTTFPESEVPPGGYVGIVENMRRPYKDFRIEDRAYDLSFLPFCDTNGPQGRNFDFVGLGSFSVETVISALLTVGSLYDRKCNSDHITHEEKKNLVRWHLALPPSERLGLLHELRDDLLTYVASPSSSAINRAIEAIHDDTEVPATAFIRNALVSLIRQSEEASQHTVYQLYHELLKPKGTTSAPSIPMMVRQFMRFLAMDLRHHASELGIASTTTTANPDGSSSSSTTPSAGKEAVGSLTGAGI